MFWNKRQATYAVIRWWDEDPGTVAKKKVCVILKSIQLFKKKFRGVSNSPACFGFVSDAMEVVCEMVDEKKELILLIPEFKIGGFHPQDKVILSLNEEGSCFAIEKIDTL